MIRRMACVFVASSLGFFVPFLPVPSGFTTENGNQSRDISYLTGNENLTTVMPLLGKVWVKQKEKAAWRAANAGEVLLPFDQVFTEGHSAAVLVNELDLGMVRLGEVVLYQVPQSLQRSIIDESIFKKMYFPGKENKAASEKKSEKEDVVRGIVKVTPSRLVSFLSPKQNTVFSSQNFPVTVVFRPWSPTAGLIMGKKKNTEFEPIWSLWVENTTDGSVYETFEFSSSYSLTITAPGSYRARGSELVSGIGMSPITFEVKKIQKGIVQKLLHTGGMGVTWLYD